MVLWVQPIGGAIALILAVAWGEHGLTGSDLVWSALAGLCGPTALVFFYRGLAIGRMGVVAPIAGVLGAGIPVMVGGLFQGVPAPAQLAGIGLALVSVVMVTRGGDAVSGDRRGVPDALIAGLGFGAFFVLMGQVGEGAVFLPFVIVRIVASVVMVAVVLAGRSAWRLARPSLVPVAIAGVLDLGGNLWYLLAAQQGRLDIAAVLSSLYPVVTIVLAAALLRERVGRVQAAGILVALGAIVLIAAG